MAAELLITISIKPSKKFLLQPRGWVVQSCIPDVECLSLVGSFSELRNTGFGINRVLFLGKASGLLPSPMLTLAWNDAVWFYLTADAESMEMISSEESEPIEDGPLGPLAAVDSLQRNQRKSKWRNAPI